MSQKKKQARVQRMSPGEEEHRPDCVQRASEESFPASDPPSWTPTTGTGDRHSALGLDLTTIRGQQVIDVLYGRGEELRIHLESHGIHAKLVPADQPFGERLEVERDVDPVVLQAVVDEWEQ